jgi:hypothetical protein
MRRYRQWITAALMFALAFAQVVTAAHACPTGAASQASSPAMPSDCPEMAKQAVDTLNACLSHCDFGQQVDVQTDAPVAATAPQAALTIRLTDARIRTDVVSFSLFARAAGPPAQLVFSRFLI